MPDTENNAPNAEMPLIEAPSPATPLCWMARIEEHPAWPSLARVPETLTALIPLRQFTVRALLLLDTGQTIESDRPLAEDIPMKIGSVQIAWGEFEVVEHRMALRVTRVA
jgi:flagellar motor switch protein FliM